MRQVAAALYITLCAATFSSVAAAQEASESPEPIGAIEEATAARNLATDANAAQYAENTWNKAEKSWKQMQSALAKDKLEKADKAALEARALYDEAELLAIQNKLLFAANGAIEQSLRNKASRYAPQTLERARRLVAETEQQLATDRYAQDAASATAALAAETARHAGQIAAIASVKPKTEDVILQWENYLGRLQLAAGFNPPVDTKTGQSINLLEQEIKRLKQSEAQLTRDLTDSQAFNAAMEDEIRELDKRLGGASTERQQLMIRLEEQARSREQFAQAEALFGPDEALVLRQSKSVVVRVIGLRFASGSPNLDAGNEALLDKLAAVIAIWPDSMLVVEGHTDSRGSDRINKLLSEQRAQTVANFIISNMQIGAHRLDVIGHGSNKPIANNETAAGREQNRRIDLVITPSNGMSF